MGKLIKLILVLALVVGAVVLAMNYMDQPGDNDASGEANAAQQQDKGVQPQEKYGFAPLDTGG